MSKFLLYKRMARAKHLFLIIVLLFSKIDTNANAQLIKAIGDLLMPALDYLKPKEPLVGPFQGGPVPSSVNKIDLNDPHEFGSRNTICRNTVEGHTVCGFGSLPHFDQGTLQPLATGFDEILPSNCGRNLKDGTGKLCFPDGILCQQRKYGSGLYISHIKQVFYLKRGVQPRTLH